MELRKEKRYTAEDYWNLPDGQRAELIDGVFYDMASPSRQHQEILGELYYTVRDLIRKNGGSCKVEIAPFAVQLFDDRDDFVEPDMSVICDRSKLTDKGCIGAPDWIVEIASPGSIRYDQIDKAALYEEAGVRHYWVVNPMKERVTVYDLSSEEGEEPIVLYTFDQPVPVALWDGSLTIDFREIVRAVS